MRRNESQLIKETSELTGIPKEKVRRIIEGYYAAMDTRYFSRFGEFTDKWFVYRLSGYGRRKFIFLLKEMIRSYNEVKHQRRVIEKYKKTYRIFLQFIAKMLNLNL